MNFIDPNLVALVAEQREFIRNLTDPFAPPAAQPPPLLSAREFQLPNCSAVSVRVLRPQGDVKAVYLHLHGGGFMHGNAAMNDVANSVLANAVQSAVVSVNYRLAPQYSHPTAVNDCEAAALWLIKHARHEFGTERLLIGGESVGASLAVLTLLRLRDVHQAQHYFRGANLAVGNYDFSMTPSQRAATEAMFLSPTHLAEIRAAAFPNQALDALRDANISSLYADLREMPPALFSVGTYDAVLDDSLFMAARWQAAGNVAELAVYPEGPHLFMTYPTRMAAIAQQRVFEFMNRCAAG